MVIAAASTPLTTPSLSFVAHKFCAGTVSGSLRASSWQVAAAAATVATQRGGAAELLPAGD